MGFKGVKIIKVCFRDVLSDMCTRPRLKSACSSAQFDQSLLCPHEETLHFMCILIANAQAGLNLHWAHMFGGTPSDVATQPVKLHFPQHKPYLRE